MVDYLNMHVHEQDEYDLNQLYDILENQVLPLYYENPDTWRHDCEEWNEGCSVSVLTVTGWRMSIMILPFTNDSAKWLFEKLLLCKIFFISITEVLKKTKGQDRNPAPF